jgi:hypothetical protein
MRVEVTEDRRKLHNEELNDLYSAPNIVRLIKSRMRWAGLVARMGVREAYTGFWWGNLRERDHFGDPDVDGRIILKWIFRKWDVGVWTGSSCLRVGTDGGHCGFHKMLGNSSPAEKLLASQKGPCSME